MSRPSLFGGLSSRSGNIEDPGVPLSWQNLASMILGPSQTDSGVLVTETTALRMAAVWRAVTVIGGLSGSLPLHTFKAGTRDRAPSVMDDPHPDMSALEWRRLCAVHRSLWGNFTAQKIRNNAGQIEWLLPLNPARVRFGKARPIPENPSGKVFHVTDDHGETHDLTPREVFHVPGMGYDGVSGLSPIHYAGQGIGLALAAERHGAKLFGSGNLLSGFLKTPQRLEQTQAEAMQDRWRAKMQGLQSAHQVAVLDSGADFQSLTMPSDSAQMLESREFAVSEIGRIFGVPPFLMGEMHKSTSWGTGLEQQMTGFVTVDLGPTWLQPLEARVDKELLAPVGQYCRYAVNGLLRGDSTARAEFYRSLRELGVLNADDIRELEDMPPLPDGAGGQVYLQPLNFGPLGANPDAETAVTEARNVVEMVQKVYLGVGVVLTAEEARALLNRAGGDLPLDNPLLTPPAPPAIGEK